MLKTKLVRTTVSLPEPLFFEIKEMALFERRSFRELVAESLNLYKESAESRTLVNAKKESLINPLFGSWGKGSNGKDYLRKIRYGKDSKNREDYLKSLWKKSS